jgi:hypothetical protein
MRVGSSGLMKPRVSEALRSISRQCSWRSCHSKGVGRLGQPARLLFAPASRHPTARGASRPQESRQRFGCHSFAGWLEARPRPPNEPVFEKSWNWSLAELSRSSIGRILVNVSHSLHLTVSASRVHRLPLQSGCLDFTPARPVYAEQASVLRRRARPRQSAGCGGQGGGSRAV